MVDIQKQDSTTRVTVSSSGQTGSVTTQNNAAEYWSEVSKDWAVKLGDKVNREDYSSKYYAQESKSAYEDTKTTSETAITNINTLTTNFETLADEQLAELSTQYTAYSDNLVTTQNTALSAITTAQTTATEAVETAQSTAETAITTDKETALSEIAEAKSNFDTNAATLLSEYNTNASTKETELNTLSDTLQSEITATGTTTQETINTTAQTAIDNINTVAQEQYVDGVVFYDEYEEGDDTEIIFKSSTWGEITGTLSDQTDLQEALDLKANTSDIPDISNLATKTELAAKQDVLTAGDNITIENNVISATGGGSSGTTYTAGDGITITDNAIAVDTTVVATQTDLAAKQDAGNYVTKTDKTNINVIGVNKSTQTISGTIFAADGIIFGGTAKAAGLVTRGICGITTPTDNYGSCEKEHLYINFDGTNQYTRQLVLAAPNAGTKIDNTTYGYTYGAIRGDDMVQYVAAAVSGKADTATTLSGYGITDAYTKTEVDDLIGDISTVLDTINGESV